MIYDYVYLRSIGLTYLEHRCLRFEDAFPAIAYAFGIPESLIKEKFIGPYWGLSNQIIPPSVNVNDQIEFIKRYAVRYPKSVLEIGAGRGDVACTLTKLGVSVTANDISPAAETWFKELGKMFFGESFTPPVPMVGHINSISLDFSKFDTILMVESLEHIKEGEFTPVWDNIVKYFHGLFIITNTTEFWPIDIGGPWANAEEDHCRVVDDQLYDRFCSSARAVVYRNKSHLVLEF